MRIIGSGICGIGEADKYLEATLRNLKELCDDVIILGNNIDAKSKALVRKYKCVLVHDNREWGLNQHKIKQDFLESHISVFKPDWILSLDMDEVLMMNRSMLESLANKSFDIAYYFWCLNLWNDNLTHNEDLLFEDIRFYKYLPNYTQFKNQPLHGGMAPEYSYTHGTHSQYHFEHYGLLKQEDRQKKIDRYLKYDPNGKYLPKYWYESLSNLSPTLKMKKDFMSPQTQFRTKKISTEKVNNDGILYKFINRHGKLIILDNYKHYLETKGRPGFQYLGEEKQVF